MRSFLLCPVAISLVLTTSCAQHSPHYVSPRWKMGQRRGQGVEPDDLHRRFLLAHRARVTPEDPRNADERPDYLLAEALWFAGDRDFATAVTLEPLEVRRSVARSVVIAALLPDFPSTYALLAPLDPPPNPALQPTPPGRGHWSRHLRPPAAMSRG